MVEILNLTIACQDFILFLYLFLIVQSADISQLLIGYHTQHTHSQLLSTIFLSLQSDAGHITFIMCQLLVAQNLFISNYLLHLIAVCNEHGLYLYLYNGSSKLFLSCCYLLFVNVTKQCALSAVQYRFYVFHMDEPLLLNST